MSRLGEALVPARLGTRFRWLLASSWISNLGDGIGLAAGPLLVASQTRDPLLVALATLLQQLPWLLFGLLGGALADRLDRRLLVAVSDLCRAVVLGLLVTSILTGTVNIALVLVAVFLVGTAEVFVDTAATTLMPTIVEKADYGIANARLMGGFVVANQLAGPPIGAALFATGMALPFVTQAVCVAFGALLVLRISFPKPVRTDDQHIRQDIVDGVRWLWHHPAVRTLTLTIVTFNVTFGAAWSVLVLYSLDRLQMGPVGFGLLTTASAIGGVVGTASYGWLERHISLGNIMRVGLIIETLTHLVLALTTVPWVALTVFFVFGVHAFVWGTTSSSVRQRAVPSELQGRVGSAYMIGVFGGMVAGGLLGGLIARWGGITAPFWFAFVGSAAILAWIWPRLHLIAHNDELSRASSPSSSPSASE